MSPHEARRHVLARLDRIPDSDSVLVRKDVLRALVVPAEGVVLSQEERSFLADMVRTWYGGDQEPSMADLAARLDVSS